MKKSLLFTLALASASAVSTLSSSALANSFGVRLGAPLGVQYTADNALGRNLDLRVAVALNPFYGSLTAGAQIDLLTNRPLGDSANLSFFYGGGANFSTGFGSYSGFGVGAQGTGGLAYQIDPSISVFVDASVGVYFFAGGGVGGVGPYTSGAIGVNFKL